MDVPRHLVLCHKPHPGQTHHPSGTNLTQLGVLGRGLASACVLGSIGSVAGPLWSPVGTGYLIRLPSSSLAHHHRLEVATSHH